MIYLLFTLLVLIGASSLFYAVVYQFRTARNRRPGISYVYALWLFTIILSPSSYTNAGLENRKKTIRGLLLFAICFVLALLVGIASDDFN